MTRSVAIVDYGMGNLRSLEKALERAGASSRRIDSPEGVASADRIVIPGQGAFGQAMGRLAAKGMTGALGDAIRGGKPALGICLGLQLLFEGSEEAPGVSGLGILPGEVSVLPLGPGIKRPHMGWSPVTHHGARHPALLANASGGAFYFVHSYARFIGSGTAGSLLGVEIAECEHGARFVAAVARDGLVATQFHPEKSQAAGARLIEAWLAL